MSATLLALVAVVLGPGGATTPIELIWDADLDCPGPAEVVQQIERFLTMPLDDADPIQVVGHIRADGPGFALELDIRSPGPVELVEHHELSAATCVELGEVAGLLIASVVEPLVFTRDPMTGATPMLQHPTRYPAGARVSGNVEAPPDPAPVAVAVEVTPEPAWELVAISDDELDGDPDRTRARRWSGLVGVTSGAMLNLLPEPGGGVQLDARADRDALRLGGSVGSWFAPGFHAPDGPEVGGRVWAGSGSLVICGVPRYRSLRFPLCAQAGAGFMHGRGVGIEQPQTKVLPWGWLGAHATLEWWFRDRVAIGVGAAVIGSVARPAFTIEGSNASHVTPPVAARAELGVITRIGPKRRSNGLARR